jgi:hypothetical protein
MAKLQHNLFADEIALQRRSLRMSCLTGDVKSLNGLLERGGWATGQIETCIKTGDAFHSGTPLFLAAAFGFVDLARLLIQHGADLNNLKGNWNSLTPLGIASVCNRSVRQQTQYCVL